MWKSDKEAIELELNELKQQHVDLQKEANERDSAIVDFLRAYDEIESSIDQIKSSEKSLRNSSNNAEGKAVQERILDDFKQINSLIIKNNERIQSLSKKLSNFKSENKKLAELIELLRDELAERVEEVSNLKEELVTAYEAFDALNDLYVESVGVIEEKENELNTAFYAIGSFKELKENNVLKREAGISGLVGAKALHEDLNADYFKKIDIRMLNRIETFSTKTKLATSHPKETYTWENEGDNNRVLVIKDTERFWSVSKYLVIVVN